MAISNNVNPEAIAYTMIRCSKLTEKQLKRLTGEERVLIAKMSRLLQFKDPKDFPKPGEVLNLTNHLVRIENTDKKVFFITAIFRDFVQSINCTLTDLNSGKKSAEELIAKDLFNQLTDISKEKIVDNENYKQLKADALAGDGYAISFLKIILEDNNIVDPDVDITTLYKAALAKNHPAIVESEMRYWANAREETFNIDFTEEKLLQMFNYIPLSKLNTNSETNKTMAQLCQRVKTRDATVYYDPTLKRIDNFQNSYKKLMSYINNNNIKLDVAYTMMFCSKLPKKQLKRLTGEERVVIKKMSSYLQFNDLKDAPKKIEVTKLITHLKRIEAKRDKKVFFITAIFRDFVRSRNYTLADLNSVKPFAQEFIAIKLFTQLENLEQAEINNNENYKQLKAAALSGDGSAICFLKIILEDNNIVDPDVDITTLYKAALAKNNPATVEFEMFFWANASDDTFNNFTENQLLQMFKYIPPYRFKVCSKTMTELCNRLKKTDIIFKFTPGTRLQIENFLKSYASS